MAAVDWDSVPVTAPPPGAVEVTENGWGFLAVACILELGVPNALYRLERERAESASGDEASIEDYLDAADMTGPPDPLAHHWFIVPPACMPTEGFWEALAETEAVRAAGEGPVAARHGLREALGVLYSNS